MLARGAFPPPGEVSRWPEPERREPRLSDRHYLALGPLAEQLRGEIVAAAGGRHDLRVLDVGCGSKPYLPLTSGIAGTYLGVDAVEGELVDVVGVAERLPLPDGCFDLVICTQVLEHVDDPARALAELHRVLAPGGTALVSTHGVFLYHPDPLTSDRDYWRWTHSGLRRVAAEAAPWHSLSIVPQGEVLACLGYVVAQFADELGGRLPTDLPRRVLLSLVNRCSRWLDRRFPPNARFPRPGSMSANYLLTAVKAPGRPVRS